MKRCSNCLADKSPSEFHVSSDRKDGRSSWCKSCFKTIANQAGKRKRERGLCRCGNRPRTGKRDCSDCATYAANYKKRRRTNPDYVADERKQARDRYHGLKEDIRRHYGEVCLCCKESAVEFLTVDHLRAPSSYHGAPRSGQALFAWLRRNNFPEGFRTLCMNCNFALGHWGYCPHGNLSS